MLGSFTDWILSAVMCPASGSTCLYTTPIPTKVGNLIQGQIYMDTSVPQKYTYIVNITDLTAASVPQILKFSTKYFVPWCTSAN